MRREYFSEPFEKGQTLIQIEHPCVLKKIGKHFSLLILWRCLSSEDLIFLFRGNIACPGHDFTQVPQVLHYSLIPNLLGCKSGNGDASVAIIDRRWLGPNSRVIRTPFVPTSPRPAFCAIGGYKTGPPNG